MRSTPRTAVLVPSDRRAQAVTTLVKEAVPGAKIFNAGEIETSKEPFVKSRKAVAILAGRYDGIDFPNSDCRLLVVDGMPKAVNLQERFLISRMGASVLLNDRLMTRIVQAFGRCTRSATDYSAVVVIGDDIMNLLIKSEKRSLLHPELQAELEFGLEQSKEATISGIEGNFRHFLAQDEEWRAAEVQIPELRDSLTQVPMEGADELLRGVADEVAYQNALWDGDHVGALDHARGVLTALKSPALKGYHCLWSYLAGSAAFLATKVDGQNLQEIASKFFYGAAKESSGLSWLRNLARDTGVAKEEAESSIQDGALLERFEAFLDDIGSQSDNKIVRFEKQLREGLAQSDKGQFEAAHVMLGRMLGYDAGNKETPGAPDPWWIVDENLCLIFEDNSAGKVGGALDVGKARQASTHPNWARSNLQLAKDVVIIPVLVSPAKTADTDALPHLRGVALWPLADFRAWAERAISAVEKHGRVIPVSQVICFGVKKRGVSLSAKRLTLKSLVEQLHMHDAFKRLQPK